MTEDGGRWLVYAGAAFDIWRPDTGNHFASVDADVITGHLQDKRLRQHKTSSSAFSDLPYTVIKDAATLPCYRPRIAFRDVTKQDNTRTVIAALVPGQIVLTHTAPYLLLVAGTARDEAYLLGVLSSMILDWYARRVVEIHVTFHLLNNFPIPEPDADDPVAKRVVTIAGRLAAVDDRYADWATEVGVEVGSVSDEETRNDLVCELDACVARLYGLNEEDLVVIYETFHTGADYSDRRERVLEHFRNPPTADAVQDDATVA
jgi:hypothetical protein